MDGAWFGASTYHVGNSMDIAYTHWDLGSSMKIYLYDPVGNLRATWTPPYNGGANPPSTGVIGNYYYTATYSGTWKETSASSTSGTSSTTTVVLSSSTAEFLNAPYDTTVHNIMTIHCKAVGGAMTLWVYCPDGSYAWPVSGAPLNGYTISSGQNVNISINVNNQVNPGAGMWHFHATPSDGWLTADTYVKIKATDPTPQDILWMDGAVTRRPDTAHPGFNYIVFNVNFMHTSSASVLLEFMTADVLHGQVYLLYPPNCTYSCPYGTFENTGYHYVCSEYASIYYWVNHGNIQVSPSTVTGVRIVNAGTGAVIGQFSWGPWPYGQ
jgi:hypothetical protein